MKKSVLHLLKLVIIIVLTVSMIAVLPACRNKENQNVNVESGNSDSVIKTSEDNSNDENIFVEDIITIGVFTYTIHYEGEDYVSLLHFYSNGLFYYSRYNNKEYIAGYYEIENAPFEIYTVGGICGEENEADILCDSKITFYEMDNETVVGEAGYNNEEDLIIGFTLQGNRDFIHEPDSEHKAIDETGVEVMVYYLESDQTRVISFMHNGTFEDLIGNPITGSWTLEKGIYNLTNNDTGNTYTLTQKADSYAKYKDENGNELMLKSKPDYEIQLVLVGSIEAAKGEMTAVLHLYNNDTADITISYDGKETITSGSWVLADGYTHITFMFNGAEHIAIMDFDTQTFSMEYVVNDGEKDVTIFLEQE